MWRSNRPDPCTILHQYSAIICVKIIFIITIIILISKIGNIYQMQFIIITQIRSDDDEQQAGLLAALERVWLMLIVHDNFYNHDNFQSYHHEILPPDDDDELR